MERGLQVYLLGPISVTWADQEIMLRGQLQRTLMAALASEAGRVIPADRLIEMLWAQQPPRSAKMKLQGLVSALRKAIGDYANGLAGTRWPLVTREPGYLLSLDGVRVDLRDYRELLKRADGELQAGFVDSASICLGEALASWRGPALADVRSPVLGGLAAALEQGRLLTIERKAACDLRLGRYDAVAELLMQVVAVHPLREGARAALMLAFYQLGCRAEALELYRQGRKLLQDQIGIEPGRLLRQLHQLMLADSPQLTTLGILGLLGQELMQVEHA